MENNVRFGAPPFDCPRSGGAVSALVRVIICATAFVLTGPTAAKPAVSDTGYEIVHMILTPSLYWVDNNRLLFAGIKRADMEAAIAAKESDRVGRLGKLYLWDRGTKSARLYADARAACFSNGFISYRVRIDKASGKQVVREGPFGSEKAIEKPLLSREELSTQKRMGATVSSNFTCKTHRRNELAPPVSRYRSVVVLREGDGYLDLGPGLGADTADRQAYPRNLTLYQAKTRMAITLPMTWEEDLSPTGVVYSEYEGAYVLRPRAPRGAPIGLSRPWPKNQPLVVYLLWTEGRVEAKLIPYWPAEYLIDPRPTKAGWIFGGGKSRQTGGLYLFDGKAVSKLDEGFVREIAVSPDGCEAAVGINNKPYDMGTPISLKVFDICVAGGQ